MLWNSLSHRLLVSVEPSLHWSTCCHRVLRHTSDSTLFVLFACVFEKNIYFFQFIVQLPSEQFVLADIEIKNSLRLFGEPCLELLKSVFLVSLFSVKRAAGRGGVKEWSLSHLTSSLNCHLCVLIS